MAVILHVGYYHGLLQSRHIMLEQQGHQVISAFGNDQAMALVGNGEIDLIVVGFSAAASTRNAMIRWFKQNVPETPVVALLANTSEHFPEADCETVSEDPQLWLTAVSRALGAAG
jgi:DNA-binding NtrC family response regulator